MLRDIRSSDGRLPDTAGLPLEYSIAHSVVEEFVLNHQPSDVLTELVQNEFDAGGSRVEVAFGEASLRVSGNGVPVGPAGWKRLSVMLGRGHVAGSDRVIKPKTNSIGSKNFGLRSLFLFGDQIYIRSGGRQTVLDVSRGTLLKPRPEVGSRKSRGIHIEVPYRTGHNNGLEPFGPDKEEQVLASFSRDLTPILIKLVQPGTAKSLQELVVSSERCGTRIRWKQSAEQVRSPRRGIKVVQRSARAREVSTNGSRSESRRKLEEIEFQKAYRIPAEFGGHTMPDYFKASGNRIRLAVSVRVYRGRIDLREPGRFFYPLGLRHGLTGTAVNVNAPFQLDSDRSQIVDPINNSWNAWLLDLAADLTVELLVSDWLDRFGPDAYLALDEVGYPATTEYADAVASRLRESSCWPTRARRRGRSGSPVFVKAEDIVVPDGPLLDGFLADSRYLDTRLSDNLGIQQLAKRCGARAFTVNSLVRLRCAGSDSSSLTTRLADDEAHHYFTNFPNPLREESLQQGFARALDAHSRKLSGDNREDLRNSPTTLAADGTLQAPSIPLWVVDPTIAEAAQVPQGKRLHPDLTKSRTIAALCKKFNLKAWVRKVAQNAQDEGMVSEEERVALYRYILSTHGRMDSRTQALLRKSPVLHDHRGQWVAPRDLTVRRAAGAIRLEAALHFPHQDYAKDADLARSLRFKQKINRRDLVSYAKEVTQRPELAEGFEETLWRLRSLITRPVVEEFSHLAFLRSPLGGLVAPPDLYLKSALNTNCLGKDAPFVSGSWNGLYKRLGCMDKPRSSDILVHLSSLTERGHPPSRPEVLYPALVDALRKERQSTDQYDDESIIWVSYRYSKPKDVLLGSRHRRTFLQAVP